MIQWWCTAQQRPWTWEWIPYPGVWLATLLPAAWYLRVTASGPGPVTARQRTQFLGGLVVFWLASDWPLGALGAGYLASAHMTQFLLYTLGAAPLLMLGTPEWLARRLLDRFRLGRAAAFLGRSLVASAVIYNVGLVLTHSPGAVDTLRTSQIGSFLMDVVWLLIGFVLWMPVLSPVRALRTPSAFGRIAYLFVTTSVVSVIPASFLTFTRLPIYAIYELAPRVGSITAPADQQMAGIVMKLGSIPVVWSTITVLWFRWAASERPVAPLSPPAG
jgi:putative membrane protein